MPKTSAAPKKTRQPRTDKKKEEKVKTNKPVKRRQTSFKIAKNMLRVATKLTKEEKFRDGFSTLQWCIKFTVGSAKKKRGLTKRIRLFCFDIIDLLMTLGDTFKKTDESDNAMKAYDLALGGARVVMHGKDLEEFEKKIKDLVESCL